MTEDAPKTKQKRRSQAEIKAEMRAALMAEIKAELVATPADAATKAAAEIAAAEKDINKQVSQAPNILAERVWIVLQESPYIQRGSGQFFGVNGMGYFLKPGKKAFVPKSIVDVLEHATEDIPDVDPETLQIVGWRTRHRFPFSIVSAPAA